MIHTIRSISSLLAAVGILLLGSGLLGTVVSLRANLEAFSQGMIGLIMSGFFLGYVGGSYLCPRIIHTVGHIRSFSAFAAVGCASVILHGLWVDPYTWLALRLVTGISMLGMYLVIESWLNSLADNRTRGRLFGVYMTINLLALGCGQFLLPVYEISGLAPFALVALFFCLALVPIALTRMPQPSFARAARFDIGRLYTISPLGVAGALTAGMVSGAFWGMAPVYALNAGFDEAGIARFMSGVIFGGALLQWPIGRWSDNHDRRLVIFGASLVAGLSATAVFLLIEQYRAAAMVSTLLFGGCAFSIYSLSVAHTNDHVDADEVLEAGRGLLLITGLGAAIGPVLSGVLMETMGTGILMPYFAALQILLAGIALQRRRVGVPIDLEDQAEFIAMARTSDAVLELDPRAEHEEAPDPSMTESTANTRNRD